MGITTAELADHGRAAPSIARKRLTVVAETSDRVGSFDHEPTS
jgi:hypothetical protein